jgi:hypothetical protein
VRLAQHQNAGGEVDMHLDSSLFQPLPSKEKLLERIEFYKERNADITSYIWYLLPLATRFGDRVFDVAAKSLTESGLSVTAEQLRSLAHEVQTPEGQKKYARNRALHIGSMITSYKQPGK